MTDDIQTEDPNEKLKKRALDAYKRHKKNMDVFTTERTKANDYYYGEPLGNEVKGRCQLVSREVYETIEGYMPGLMRIFYGGQNVVEVTPQNAEDDLKAKLMEEKLNYDFKKSNNGFKILYQFFKDALLHRIGVVNYWWDTTPKWKFHSYDNVTETYIRDLEMGYLGNQHIIDEKVLVSEGGISPEGIPVEATYNITCREKIKQSIPKFTNVKLEDINFNIDMVDIEDLEGVIDLRCRIHKKKAATYGFNEEDIENIIDDYEANAERQARFADMGGLSFITDDAESDFVYLHQFFLYDFDSEGNPIPKIVHMIGDKVGKVQVNKYGRPPICLITPTMISHRLVGMSSAKAVMYLQDASSAFLRMLLDSGYYQNMPVSIWNPFLVPNIPEERIPGMNIVMDTDGDPRMAMYNPPPSKIPPEIASIYSQVLPKIKSRLTGLNDFNQGLDPKALATRTSGGISQLMSSSQQPQELIARCFAETGVRDMFVAAMQMNIDFLDIEMNMKINDKWMLIGREDNPERGVMGINGLFDISIDIGIGTGSKDMNFNHLINMLNVYGGVAGALKDPAMIMQVITPENVRNVIEAAWEMIGFKNAKGRFTSNGGGINPAMAQGMPVQGTPGQPGVQGTPVGSGQVYPREAQEVSAY